MSSSKQFSPTPFKFKNEIKAAETNWSLLMARNFDLSTNIKDSLLDPSFEFNNLTYLAMVMDKHPSWKDLFPMLTEGIKYPLQDISKEDRILRLEANLARENHPTRSQEAKDHIIDFIKKDYSDISFLYLNQRLEKFLGLRSAQFT